MCQEELNQIISPRAEDMEVWINGKERERLIKFKG
jgi:hypothetical protein